jgi:hypothetical protein
MISYALRCDRGHGFDSWFQSAEAFETLARAGHLSCATCGSTKVAKAVMAPRVAKSRSDPAPAHPKEAAVPMLRGAPSEVETALAELRRKVEESSDYVGRDFARQARAMHSGEEPERSIYGEARPEEARGLIEEGVPLMPLPFRPRRKMT